MAFESTVAVPRSAPRPRRTGIPRRGYVVAVLLAALMLLVRLALGGLLATNVPYLLSFVAITASALLYGFRPALLALAVSALGVNLLVRPPFLTIDFDVSTAEVLGNLLYLLVGVTIAWLGGSRQEAFLATQRAREDLAEREAMLRALNDNLPGAVTYQLEVSADGRRSFGYVGANVEGALGVTPREIYEDPRALYGLVVPEHLPRLVAAEEEATARHEPFEVEVALRLRDGRLRWIHLASRPRRLPDGRIVWDGVQFDVTERHEAREALERLNADLERRVEERTEQLLRSNRELEQFAFVASHDLKAPLRTITSYLQLLELKFGGALDEKGRRYFSFTVEAAQRMNTLIDDLLAYSRLGRERRAMAVDAERVLTEVLDNLAATVTAQHASVLRGPLPEVVADETQLRQVLQNLVGNALKFHAPDRDPQVRVAAHRDGDLVRFSVSDNGVGIAPEFHERVFGMFQRLHPNERYAGSGVGLAIVRKIVEEHGGRVWVESREGEGATFHFTFPAVDRVALPPA